MQRTYRRTLAIGSAMFFAMAAMPNPVAAQDMMGHTIGRYMSLFCSGPVNYTIADDCTSDFIQIAEGEHSEGRACIPKDFTEAQIAAAMLQYLRDEVANHPDMAGNETTTEMANAAHALWPCQ